MKTRHKILFVVLVAVLLSLFAPEITRAAQVVSFERLPEGGVQPQSLVDAAGTVHLVYLTGDARASDVAYTFRLMGQKEFAPVMKANHQSCNAVAAGTMRGVQLAVDKEGTVHVLWNGSQTATPKQGEGSPLLYARKLPGAKEFEPERNLMTKTYALDGGASLAAGPGWKTGQCPMSTAWLRDDWAAWEVNGQVKFTRRDGSMTFSPTGEARRKHPVAVPAPDGSTLVLWTEGTGWNKGGSVAWQIIGKDGQTDGPIQKRAGLPVWGLATAWANPKNGWIVLY